MENHYFIHINLNARIETFKIFFFFFRTERALNQYYQIQESFHQNKVLHTVLTYSALKSEIDILSQSLPIYIKGLSRQCVLMYYLVCF